MKFFLFMMSVVVTINSKAAGVEKVAFVEPKDHAVVGKAFHVKMMVEGRQICEAGKESADKSCGHHHILVDSGPVPRGQAIVNDATHLHYGKGQTEADLNLTTGKHRLTLQFADFAHRSYGEELSQSIEITVK